MSSGTSKPKFELRDGLLLLTRLSRLCIAYRDAQEAAINAKFVVMPMPGAPVEDWMLYREFKGDVDRLEKLSAEAWRAWHDCCVANRQNLEEACKAVDESIDQIAAAPDLFDATRKLRSTFCDVSRCPTEAVQEDAIESSWRAMTKATGGAA